MGWSPGHGSRYEGGMTVPSLTVHPTLLHEVVSTIVQASGSDAREAGLVADHLVAANLAGHDSHGVGMVPSYLEALAVGELHPGVGATVVKDAGAVLTIDGGQGYGQVVAHEAMELAIARARELGVCVTAVRGSHHVGRIGHWAEQCARAGLVSIHLASVVGERYAPPSGERTAASARTPCACASRARARTPCCWTWPRRRSRWARPASPTTPGSPSSRVGPSTPGAAPRPTRA